MENILAFAAESHCLIRHEALALRCSDCVINSRFQRIVEGIYGSMRRTAAAKVRLSAFAELTLAAFCESYNIAISMMDHSVCL